MVIYHRLIIGVLNDYRVADIGDGSIVIECAPRPIPSGESYAGVTVPVTYAAIEADMRKHAPTSIHPVCAFRAGMPS
jgi:hypothetical protein